MLHSVAAGRFTVDFQWDSAVPIPPFRLHRWFEDRAAPCTLLVFIDDATSRLMELRFVPSESTFAYFETLKSYLQHHGKPVAFYSDKHSIFRVSREDAASGDGMTQFGRALSELNIEILCANTSQAKGRVERAHHTLQDRLVKELRLAGISTIEAANAFLPAFVQTYNARFAKTPARDRDLHWPIARALWQQHCLEVASRLRHVGVVDEMRRTYRHHGRQREAPRRIATFRHATLPVAPHRYATLDQLS